MTAYIYFCPATDVEQANAIAEENGHGQDNISVPLVSTMDQSQWFGAHSYVDLLSPKPTQWSDESLNVIVTEYNSGTPLEAWNAALAANNLIQPVVEPI